MPPLGSDVGANIRELKAAHPDWADDRIQAAAINAAREHGGKSNTARSRAKARRERQRQR